MKNKTKLTCVPDHSHAKPFNTVVTCQCGNIRRLTVYPALGTNYFECAKCDTLNKVLVNNLAEAEA